MPFIDTSQIRSVYNDSIFSIITLTVSKSNKYNKYTIVSSWEEYMGDRTGQQIGNYQLVKLLGRGGFAEVYLGEHIYLKTQAAIKLLQHQLEQKDLAAFL